MIKDIPDNLINVENPYRVIERSDEYIANQKENVDISGYYL